MSGSQIQTKRSQAALAGDHIRTRLLREGKAPTVDTVGLLLEAIAPGMFRADFKRAADAADQQLRHLAQHWAMSWALVRTIGDQIAMVVWDRGILDTGTLPLAILDGIEGTNLDWNWYFRADLVLEVFGEAAYRLMETARKPTFQPDDQPGREAWARPVRAFTKRYKPTTEVMVEQSDGSVRLHKIYEMPVWQAYHQKPIMLVQGGAVEVSLDRVVEPLDILTEICQRCWVPYIERQLPGIVNRLGLYDGHLTYPGYAQDYYGQNEAFPTWAPEAFKVVATKRPSQWVLVLKGERSTFWIVAMTAAAGLVVTGYNADRHTAPSLESALKHGGYKPNARAKVIKWLNYWGFKIEDQQP